MIRYLTLIEVLSLHRQIIEQSGGALGLRDLGILESALAQPRMTFGGEDLYPTLIDPDSPLREVVERKLKRRQEMGINANMKRLLKGMSNEQ